MTYNFLTPLQDFDWRSFCEMIMTQEYFWVFLGAIFLIIYFWLTIRKRRRVIHLFHSETGQVTVLRRALESLIESACYSVTPSSSPKVCIRVKNSRIFIKIKIHLFTHQHVEETSTALQNKITQILKENLGLEQIGAVNVLVTGFIEKPHAQQAEVNCN